MKQVQNWNRSWQESMWSNIQMQMLLRDQWDSGIIVEGVPVLQELKDAASAYARLFGLGYDLNLYPPDLEYTFEYIQTVFMELESCQLSTEVLVLKNKLLD